ncbi:MAG: hypothetical protein ACPIA6_06560 [Poseidonia sp.]
MESRAAGTTPLTAARNCRARRGGATATPGSAVQWRGVGRGSGLTLNTSIATVVSKRVHPQAQHATPAHG